MQNRRDFFRTTAAIAGALALPRRGEADKRRPNILFIMTDQQHAGMMSCAGNPYVKTPALDRLAASGIRFERAYATNPVCVPSRFSLQTGLMPSAVGIRMNESQVSVPESMAAQSLGPLLRNAGYECAYGGKVHLPGDLQRYLMEHGYTYLTADRRGQLADVCAGFLRRQRAKPFFLFASFINPHDICYMAINDYARSKGGKPVDNGDSRICEATLEPARRSGDLATFVHEHCPPLPANFEIPRGEPECITTRYLEARKFRRYVRQHWSEDMWRLHRWAYCRLTERVDAHIGRILEALHESAHEENTLVVFTSDHGDLDSAHRLEHKSILYEEAARVPLLMSWPGVIPAGKVDDVHLVSNGLDLLPTLCDYAQVRAPEGVPGMSLRAIAEQGTAQAWRDHLVVESQDGRMVRTERFKYCVYAAGRNRETLVDLRNDPGEMTNLAGASQYGAELERHRRLLLAAVAAAGDTLGRSYLAPPRR